VTEEGNGHPDAGSAGAGHAGQAGLAAELRSLALSVLDRIEPALLRMHTEQPSSPPAGCTGCPVCAVLAVLRAERPELTATLAAQLGDLLVVLRAALEEGDPVATRSATPEPSAEAAAHPRRRVQRIPVERVAP
jgi:hypothetical protein